MAVSAWAQVQDDTITRVEAITPTYDAPQRWRYLPPARDVEERGRDREFITDWRAGAGESVIVGASYRQERRVLVLHTYYQDSDGVDDMIASDHVDLIEALQPTSTYPSGTWGALRVRLVLDPEAATEDEEDGLVVSFEIDCIYRYPVTVV